MADTDDSLAGLPPALRALAGCGVERRYRKGAIFIHEGDPGGPLYFIRQGRVRAYTARDDGSEFTFGYYDAGNYIGELSIDGNPRSANVVAETAVTCSIVTLPTLERCIADDPKLAIELIAGLIRRVRVLSSRAGALALDDAYSRLLALLIDSSSVQPDGTRLMTERITQAAMAKQVGCTRPMVTRLLGELVKGGYLRQDSRCWRIVRQPPARF